MSFGRNDWATGRGFVKTLTGRFAIRTAPAYARKALLFEEDADKATGRTGDGGKKYSGKTGANVEVGTEEQAEEKEVGAEEL